MATLTPAQLGALDVARRDIPTLRDVSPAPEESDDDAAYWTPYIFIAMAVLSVESLGVLGYLLLSPSGDHRALLEVMATTFALVSVVTLPFVPRIARQSYRTTFVLTFALGSGAVLALAGALDGGADRSPLMFLLVLPVANIATAFPPRTVAFAASAAVAEFVVVVLTDADLAASWSKVVLLTVFILGIISLSMGWSVIRSEFNEKRDTLLAESVRRSKIDALTECLNHGAFFDRLQVEIDRAGRCDESLSLLIADVDAFKSFNDRYGHPAGDDTLKVLSNVMAQHVRTIDVVGRIGGDEFAVILPSTDVRGARETAERLVEALKHPDGLDVTVSLGYASLDSTEPFAKRLFRDADAGLYLAKLSGRARASGLMVDPLSNENLTAQECQEAVAWAATDTKRFEQVIREAHTETLEMRAILDAIETSDSMGLAFIDTDYRIIRVNQALASMNGSVARDWVGQRVADVVPAAWATLEPSFSKVVETGEAVVGLEVSRVQPNESGVSETWLLNCYPVIAEGLQTGICVIAIDISARKQLEQSQANLTNSAVRAIAAAAEMRDPYTGGHQDRVAHIAGAIAKELGIDPDEAQEIELAAKIHDVGKLAIPAEMLARPGRLSAAEFALMREHPQTGADLLERVGFPDRVRRLVLQHHERVDGSGYPSALCGDAVLLGARIIAVADVLEAMSSHRPYRAALGVEAALAELESGAGSRYDREVVDACVRLIHAGTLGHDTAE